MLRAAPPPDDTAVCGRGVLLASGNANVSLERAWLEALKIPVMDLMDISLQGKVLVISVSPLVLNF